MNGLLRWVEDKPSDFSKTNKIFWEEDTFLAGQGDPALIYGPRTVPHPRFHADVPVSFAGRELLESGTCFVVSADPALTRTEQAFSRCSRKEWTSGSSLCVRGSFTRIQTFSKRSSCCLSWELKPSGTCSRNSIQSCSSWFFLPPTYGGPLFSPQVHF